MRVIGAQCVQAGPKFGQRKAINAGIHFPDSALVRRCGIFLDDCLHTAFGISNDAAIVRRVAEFSAENRGGRFAAPVRIQKSRERLGPQQRRVARHDDDYFCGLANFSTGDLESVTCPALRLLKHGFGAQCFGHGADFRCLMTDDREQLRRLQRLARAHHMFEERSSAGAM